MPTPSKPVLLVNKHFTKAEKEQRLKAEKSLLTGERLRENPEVKKNPVAHKWFIYLKRLYKKIEKDDALSGPIINRYCLLQAEVSEYQEDDDRLRQRLDDLEDRREDMEYEEYIKLVVEIEKQISANDSRLMRKRKMLFDIERESLMTLAAQMRSIPKTVEKKDATGIEAYRQKRAGG